MLKTIKTILRTHRDGAITSEQAFWALWAVAVNLQQSGNDAAVERVNRIMFKLVP